MIFNIYNNGSATILTVGVDTVNLTVRPAPAINFSLQPLGTPVAAVIPPAFDDITGDPHDNAALGNELQTIENELDSLDTSATDAQNRIAVLENKQYSFEWDQVAPSAFWTINHNLGFRPGGVLVIDTAGSTCYGTVTHVDANTLTLTFSAAFSGVAYLS